MQGDEFAGECDNSIAFFEQLRSDHRSHRHPKLHRTTLCVRAPATTVGTLELHRRHDLQVDRPPRREVKIFAADESPVFNHRSRPGRTGPRSIFAG